MLRDIEFESKYCYNGEKKFLSCLDIMKLYVNYRPNEPVTKDELRKAFNGIVALEEDPYQMTRSRFISVLTGRGDAFSLNELLNILKCLKGTGKVDIELGNLSEGETDLREKIQISSQETDAESVKHALNELVPKFINEDVFFQDILCLEKADENLSEYVLKKEDYQRVQEYPKLQDFIKALEEE